MIFESNDPLGLLPDSQPVRSAVADIFHALVHRKLTSPAQISPTNSDRTALPRAGLWLITKLYRCDEYSALRSRETRDALRAWRVGNDEDAFDKSLSEHGGYFSVR